jgi:homoserine O-acetyltransferase
MQVLEWALMYPDEVCGIAPISVGAYHSPWCIATSEAQRQAIFADPKWRGGHYDRADPPKAGLAVARQIAIVSYRSPSSFREKFGRRQDFGSNAADGLFDVESYLRYQGEALVERFDAAAYVALTYAMDSHDVGRGRGEIADVLGKIDIPALVIGISSDTLYPVDEQHVLADLIPDARYEELDVPHGHDGFLIEHQAVAGFVGAFLAERGC